MTTPRETAQACTCTQDIQQLEADFGVSASTFNARAKAVGEALHCLHSSIDSDHTEIEHRCSQLIRFDACDSLRSHLMTTEDQQQSLDPAIRALSNAAHLIGSLHTIPATADQASALKLTMVMLQEMAIDAHWLLGTAERSQRSPALRTLMMQVHSACDALNQRPTVSTGPDISPLLLLRERGRRLSSTWPKDDVTADDVDGMIAIALEDLVDARQTCDEKTREVNTRHETECDKDGGSSGGHP